MRNSVSISISHCFVVVVALEWEIPVGTRFAGHNITARSQPYNIKSGPNSYVDLSLKLHPGILQSFQYYISNPDGNARPQRVTFQVWEVNFQEFRGSTNALLNSNLTLRYELGHTVRTRSGVYTVSIRTSPGDMRRVAVFIGHCNTMITLACINMSHKAFSIKSNNKLFSDIQIYVENVCLRPMFTI